MRPVTHFALVTGSSILLLFACMGSSGKSGGSTTSASIAEGGSNGDMYYEYSVVSRGKNIDLSGSIKMYLSSKGRIRVEMDMGKNDARVGNMMPDALIGSSDRPNESISIDAQNKTYSVNHINSDSLAMSMNEKKESSVKKVGEETIMGFHCVHAMVITSNHISSFFKSVDTIDVWKSNDVPMQETFKKLFNQFESRTGNFMFDSQVSSKLKEMGCEGFLVKFRMRTKSSSTMEELKKVEHRDLAASLFEVPAGYKETPGL